MTPELPEGPLTDKNGKQWDMKNMSKTTIETFNNIIKEKCL